MTNDLRSNLLSPFEDKIERNFFGVQTIEVDRFSIGRIETYRMKNGRNFQNIF